MNDPPGTPEKGVLPPRPARPDPRADPRLRRLAQLWGYSTLAGIVAVSALVIWAFVRRGRRLLDRPGGPRFDPPKRSDLPDFGGPD